MFSIYDAINILKENQKTFKNTKLVPLMDSLHSILAKDVTAKTSVPNFRRSAMDGFAVHTKDFVNFNEFVELKVLDTLYAGDFKEIPYKAKSAVRIMTGAYIPDDFNAVIKQEETKINDDIIKVYKKPEENRHILSVGEDIKNGTLLAKTREKITPAHIGVFASLGMNEIEIIESPKITLISTGSELKMPGEPLRKGKIYNSTIFHLASYIKQRGIDTINLLQVDDSLESLQKTFEEESRKSDIVITTGGVSVGEKDYIPKAVELASGEFLFESVAMRPGHPVKASRIGNTVFLHTSGSPFAAFANFQLFFWPLLEKYYNSSAYNLRRISGVISEGYGKETPFKRVVRCSIENGEVRLFTKNFSSSISNLIEANGFILQEAKTELKVGDQVEVFYLYS